MKIDISLKEIVRLLEEIYENTEGRFCFTESEKEALDKTIDALKQYSQYD
jgi:hypothetical protein